ncbi:MAG: Fic/DOC family protein [Bacilli bacterium]
MQSKRCSAMYDPYLYNDVSVLKNKLELKNQDKLNQFESAVFQLAFLKLREKPFKVNKATHILKIHKMLFGEVYEWAGEIRIINIEKQEVVLAGSSVMYEDKKLIHKQLLELDKQLSKLNIDENFIINISKIIATLWQIHPFREGNTRTVVVFLYLILQNYNLKINFELLEKHAKYFRNALVLASIGEYSEPEYLQKILKEAIFGTGDTKTKEHINNDYNKIRDYEVSNYKYNYHTKKQ